MPAPIELSGEGVDLSGRVFAGLNTGASPANAGEAVVVTVSVGGDLALVAGVLLLASLAITVSLNGTAMRLRVRRTNVAGAVIADTGPVAALERELVLRTALGFDRTENLPALKYVLTAECPNATNPSTVGGAALVAVAV